jgi:hypothetical protein
MKEIKLHIKNISPGQWSTLILELNNMSRSWRRFGPDIQLQAASVERIIAAGQVKATSRKRQALATFKK